MLSDDGQPIYEKGVYQESTGPLEVMIAHDTYCGIGPRRIVETQIPANSKILIVGGSCCRARDFMGLGPENSPSDEKSTLEMLKRTSLDMAIIYGCHRFGNTPELLGGTFERADGGTLLIPALLNRRNPRMVPEIYTNESKEILIDEICSPEGREEYREHATPATDYVGVHAAVRKTVSKKDLSKVDYVFHKHFPFKRQQPQFYPF